MSLRILIQTKTPGTLSGVLYGLTIGKGNVDEKGKEFVKWYGALCRKQFVFQ